MKKPITYLVLMLFAINTLAQQVQETEAITVPYEQQMDDVFQNVNLSGINSHQLSNLVY